MPSTQPRIYNFFEPGQNLNSGAPSLTDVARLGPGRGLIRRLQKQAGHGVEFDSCLSRPGSKQDAAGEVEPTGGIPLGEAQ